MPIIEKIAEIPVAVRDLWSMSLLRQVVRGSRCRSWLRLASLRNSLRSQKSALLVETVQKTAEVLHQLLDQGFHSAAGGGGLAPSEEPSTTKSSSSSRAG